MVDTQNVCDLELNMHLSVNINNKHILKDSTSLVIKEVKIKDYV